MKKLFTALCAICLLFSSCKKCDNQGTLSVYNSTGKTLALHRNAEPYSFYQLAPNNTYTWLAPAKDCFKITAIGSGYYESSEVFCIKECEVYKVTF